MEQIKITPIFIKHNFSFFDPQSWLSYIIRKVICFNYNHCGILYEENGIEYVVESRSSGVFKSTLENWINHRPNKEWISGKTIEVDLHDINIRLGNKYNVLSLFEYVIYKWFNFWIGDKSDKTENCSQFIADLLKLDKSYMATPKSLYDVLK